MSVSTAAGSVKEPTHAYLGAVGEDGGPQTCAVTQDEARVDGVVIASDRLKVVQVPGGPVVLHTCREHLH